MSFWIGVCLNVLALSVNHGKMPVSMPVGEMLDPMDPIHTYMNAQTHLKFLCDWIQLGWGTASPGDIFVWTYEGVSGYCYIVWLALVCVTK